MQILFVIYVLGMMFVLFVYEKNFHAWEVKPTLANSCVNRVSRLFFQRSNANH